MSGTLTFMQLSIQASWLSNFKHNDLVNKCQKIPSFRLKHSGMRVSLKTRIIANFFPIYLLFPPLFDYHDVSKCEIRFERIPENYISRLHMPLVCFCSHGTAKMKLQILAFLCWVEIVKKSIAPIKPKNLINTYFLLTFQSVFYKIHIKIKV